MSIDVKLNKQVFNKNNYTKIIDTDFKQLGVKSTQEQIDNQPTVDDLFNLYNDLFYSIPEYGNTNSHEYLIKKSSEYINYEQNLEEIIALQNEISQLRAELLEANKEIIELQKNNP